MTQKGQGWLGKVISHTYLVESIIGRGGMGVVYRATHLRTGGSFAIKMLCKDVSEQPDMIRRFREEALTVSQIRHPHIVQVTDFSMTEDGCPYIAMEFLDGEDLQQRLERERVLPLPLALELTRQVGSALHAAHQCRVVHRDVKPHNIFLINRQIGNTDDQIAKVLDFGIAKMMQTARMTQEDMILGTPQFMSPEAAQGRCDEIDGRSDQFALGVVLYRALTGVLPFDAPDPVGVLYQVIHSEAPPLALVLPSVPPDVSAAVERALRKTKEDRFPTVNDFIAALGPTPPAARTPADARPGGTTRRALGAAVGCLLGAAAVLVSRSALSSLGERWLPQRADSHPPQVDSQQPHTPSPVAAAPNGPSVSLAASDAEPAAGIATSTDGSSAPSPVGAAPSTTRASVVVGPTPPRSTARDADPPSSTQGPGARIPAPAPPASAAVPGRPAPHRSSLGGRPRRPHTPSLEFPYDALFSK